MSNNLTHFLTPKEVAQILRIAPVTVRLLAAEGKLTSVSTPGGHRRFDPQVVATFASTHNQRRTQSPHNERILIVDDDVPLTGMLRDFISDLELSPHVAIAHDGFNAGLLAASFQPTLVLLDLMMPGLDGFTVCSQIRNNPQLGASRVIAMTGYPSPENIERILSAGAQACLAKPLDLRMLKDVISQGRINATATAESF